MASGRIPGRRLALLAGLSLVVAFAFQGSRHLYETTEARYGEVAREMLAGGDLLEPTLAGRPHWSKPPLTYWAIAAGMTVTGRKEVGARLPGALAFLLTVWAVVLLGVKLWGPEAGFLAGVVYATSPLPVVASNVVSTDDLLTLWEVLAVLAYVSAWRSATPRGQRTGVALMWLSFGAGFLTKGPPALLPLLPLLFFHMRSQATFRLTTPAGLTAFALLGLSWYGWAASTHPGLLRYFFGDELVGRNVFGESHRNAEWYKPFVIYLPVLLVGQGLWSVPGCHALARTFLRPRAFRRVVMARDRPGTLLLLWFFVPLSIFFLSKSRLPLYVLPLYAPVALGVGRVLQRERRWSERGILAIAIASAAGLVLLRVMAPHVSTQRDLGQVYAEALDIAGPGRRYLLYGEHNGFGLDFYANGRVERITLTGTEAWADESLAEEIEELQTEPVRALFIAKPRDEAEVGRALVGAGLSYDRFDLGPWRAIRVGGMAAL